MVTEDFTVAIMFYALCMKFGKLLDLSIIKTINYSKVVIMQNALMLFSINPPNISHNSVCRIMPYRFVVIW